MEKRLKKYTSIPQDLYVNRSADEQLKRIVDEMQRPGYVLVARQMGKTNLLFNAKRTLENENRLFVYVDLSNSFEKERECYRNIIDNIIEPNEDLFGSIESQITSLREKELPPHKEYSKSLRVALEFFRGEIVIVLDEIDALRSADYSDNIFAQIRSNYFSRTNFPVFERLTYILSGVIEPADLIKDRNKSPFNIGDKIYLDDFTLDEHNSFIEKSNLTITENISHKIYYWTNGNPRLTFEICSSVEDLLLENKEVTEEDLEFIVKEKYLTSYDIAPIDHIRVLVKDNKLIRDAVLSVHQNKGSDLSDENKKKLYLYGIIGSDFDGEIKIKNPIIKSSLSIDWLKSIDKQNKSELEYGLQLIDKGEYNEAISILKKAISNTSEKGNGLELCNYNLGYAYHKVGDVDNAIEYFSKEYTKSTLKLNAKCFLGISILKKGEEKESVIILKEVIEEKSKDFAFRNAVLNLAPIVAKTDKKGALDLYDKLLDSTHNNSDDISEEELNRIRTLAYYYKADIHSDQKDKTAVLESLRHGLDYADERDCLIFKYYIYLFSGDKDESLKEELLNSIVDDKLTFDKKNTYPISFTEAHLYRYLDLAFDTNKLEQFERLLEYSYNYLFDRKKDKYEIAFYSTIRSENRQEILKYILNNEQEIPEVTLLRIYRYLCLINDQHADYLVYFNKFQELFLNQDNIEVNDVYVYAIVIKKYSELRELEKGLELCREIEERLIDVEDEELIFESSIIYFWHAKLSFSTKNRKDAIKFANKTIKLIQSSKKEKTSMIDEEGIQSIIDQMNHIILEAEVKYPIVRKNNYNRNDVVTVRYRDSTEIKGKYKKFENDVKEGKCLII